MNITLLPDAEWLHSGGLLRLVSALTSGDDRPRIVGGAVRDSLFGLPVNDIDLATPILPADVIKRLEQSGIKAIPTGLEHGTITAVSQGETFEITTLRRDVSTDGRRATVAFTTDWREDAARRDFTINALYADPQTRRIYDYFDGISDLQNKNLRFIGDAHQRIAEDHLRILRYFRFLARFGNDAAEKGALDACRSASNSLMALSRERIASELLKIMSAATPLHAVTLMAEHNIFAPFLPELDVEAISALSRLLARESVSKLNASPAARLLTLLPRNAHIVHKFALRLKLSNRMRNEMAALLTVTLPVPAKMRATAYYLGMQTACEVALLYAHDEDYQLCLERLADWQTPKFTMKGGDLIQRGLHAGPLVAKTLKQIEEKWVNAGFPNGEDFAAIIDQETTEALLVSKKL
jgi:poly(A) polymerase